MSSSLSMQLGQFAAGLRLGELPPRVVERAKSSLMHNLGCALIVRGDEEWPRRIVATQYAEPRETSLLLAGGGRAAMDGAV
ncbi:MAG: hypothetical protein U0802_22555, partial [Candidatus Binatia bacterium]